MPSFVKVLQSSVYNGVVNRWIRSGITRWTLVPRPSSLPYPHGNLHTLAG